MRETLIAADQLIKLLGRSRNDSDIAQLIDGLGKLAVHTIDREDGADNEYVEVKDLGLCLYFEASRLISVFFYSESKGEGYSNYKLPMPLGISFGQSKSDVVSNLGVPTAEGGGNTGYFGDIAVWIRYDKLQYSVHIEFSAALGEVQLVTFMPSLNTMSLDA